LGDAVVFRHLVYLSLGVLGLNDYSGDLREMGDGEGGAVDGIAGADADAHVGLFDGDEVVGAIADHADFEGAVAEDLA